MGRTITNILTSPLSFIDQRVGDVISGIVITAAGVVTGNPALIAFGLTRLSGALQSPQKPRTAEFAVKTSRPPRVSAYGRSRLYGAYTLFETASNGTAVDVFAVHEGKIDGIERRYLNDDPVTLTGNIVNRAADGRYGAHNEVRFYSTDGSTPGAGFPALGSLLSGLWTSQHRGDGVAAIALTCEPVKSKYYDEVYPSGVPTASIVARWQRCPDPAAADPLDESGWTWTENPVRHLLHYKLVREGPNPALPRSAAGYPAALAALRAAWWARRIAPTLSYWIAAAEDCDSPIPLRAGGTEPRYRSAVSHSHTSEHKGPIAAILATFDGWISPRSDGALVIYSGRYQAPDPVDDLIGPDEIVSYSWAGGAVDDDQATNEVICSYISSAHDYNIVETDAWRDEDDITRRGRVLSAELDAAVPSHGQSRRLAKRLVARSLVVARGTVTTNIAGRHARGKRYIWLRLAEAGAVFYEGPAEIVSASRALRGGVSFEWIAADSNIDAWNPETEEGQPAAVGDRVAFSEPTAPTVNSAIAIFEQSTAEGAGARVSIDVSGPDRSDLTWFARWRRVGAASWNEQEYPDIDPGASVVLQTTLVPVGDDIEVQAAYAVGDGRVSAWSSPPVAVGVDPNVEPPDAAVSVSLLSWTDTLALSTPAILRASSYRWRFYASDGTTLIRTITTASRTVSYAAALAATDGARRSYIVEVAGVNAAGAGASATSILFTKPAPPAPTALSIPDDPSTAVASFTPVPAGNGVAGYAFYYSTGAGFNPLTSGFVVYSAGSPAYAYALAAGTFYGKVASYDAWSRNPAMLNFTAEDSFDITSGGGAAGGGGGGAGDGGGGFELDRA